MATNELLMEHVTCPVCLDVFDDPHSLECRHIVCLLCLNQLKDNRGRVQCPECRTEMPYKKIKRDFKTAKLAESFKKEKKAESNEIIPDRQPTGCEVCKLPGKVVVCWCQTCDKYLCLSCELAHKGVPVTENHMILSEADIIAALQDWANTTMATSKENLAKVEQSISHISAHIASINANKETQEAEIDARIDDLINQLENRRTQLKHEVVEGNNYLIDTLTKSKKVFENHKPLLESSIQFLTQLSTSNDLETLMVPTAMPTSILPQQSKKIASDVSELERKLKDSAVKVVNGPDCNINAYVYVSRRNASYSNLRKVKCVEQKLYKNMHINFDSIVKMCMINDELWCCSDDQKINIFNKNCDLERGIFHNDLDHPSGLTQVPNGVIVACEEAGLLQLSTKGEYLRKIKGGNFSDVCYYNQNLYAVDVYVNKVVVYEDEFNSSDWVKLREWQIVGANPLQQEENILRISVNSFGVVISSSHGKKIFHFNHQGVLLKRAGRPIVAGKEKAPGFLSYPLLCGVDSDGIALIADHDTNLFQCYNLNKRSWRVITLKDIEEPQYALVNGTDLFVASSSQLVKYKVKHKVTE